MGKIALKLVKTEREDLPETTLGAAVAWRKIKGKGRGVFAVRRILKGEIVECAPVVPMAKKDIPDDGNVPDGYVLEWDEDDEDNAYALVLGYVMLYNHSARPNIELENDTENLTITVRALRDIRAGEELTWNYGCELWFDPR